MQNWIRLFQPYRFPSAMVAACAGLALSFPPAPCQSSSSKSSSTPNTTDSAGNKTGFAIESEMLTYTAMDIEAAALACSLAKDLGAADQNCSARSGAGPAGGIIVVASTSSAVHEFQLWRTDIATMTMLTERAERYCPRQGSRSGSTSLGSQILSMFPAGQALSFAQALLTTTAETSPVEGNILDETLVNDVAGHLRGLGVNVMLPDRYMPHSLTTIDDTHSPFLAKFSSLLQARKCVETAADGSGESHDGDKAGSPDEEKKPIAESIDAYLKSLTDPLTPAVKPTPAGTTAEPAQPTISHLNAVLRADGLALELNSTGHEDAGWYILSLKALESGGTLLKSGNAILGTKTSYSGGAIGTYSLFRLSGNVVCSGVFYNYGAPLQTSKIPNLLSGSQVLQPGKLVGGCAAGD